MEYIDPTTHETLEILACSESGCTEPEWTAPFTQHTELKVHYCNGANQWRWGWYGSDVVWEDASDALNALTAHSKAKAREIAHPVIKHINEVLEGPNDSLR